MLIPSILGTAKRFTKKLKAAGSVVEMTSFKSPCRIAKHQSPSFSLNCPAIDMHQVQSFFIIIVFSFHLTCAVTSHLRLGIFLEVKNIYYDLDIEQVFFEQPSIQANSTVASRK